MLHDLIESNANLTPHDSSKPISFRTVSGIEKWLDTTFLEGV